MTFNVVNYDCLPGITTPTGGLTQYVKDCKFKSLADAKKETKY